MLATEAIATKTDQRSSSLRVEVELVERTIQVVANLSGKKHIDHAIPIRDINLSTLLELVNLTLKPLIQDCLPVDQVDYELGPKLLALDRSDITENLENCGRCLTHTNEFLQRYVPRFEEFSRHDQVLLYSMGRNQFLEDIYERSQDAGFSHILYREFSCGYDQQKRHWQGKIDCFSPDELMEFILEQKVKRIVSINMYYLQFLAQHHGVMIQTVFEKLGLEFTIVDWDIYSFNDRFGLNKLVYDHQSMERFDIFPLMQGAWNKLLGFENTRYYCVSLAKGAIDQPIDDDRSLLLEDDYAVLCAGHARIETLLEGNRLDAALSVLDFCTEDKIFLEFQTWFYAAADYLLNQLRRPTAQKLKLWAKLIQLHFDCITLLKYEVLDQIKTERQIHLYGDEGWSQLFPQHFNGEHITKSELWEKIASREYLNLQFNNVLSYYECNPVSGDVLSCGAPFLGFPAVIGEEDNRAFSLMEFANVGEMNKKVADFNSFVDNPSLREAISVYQSNTQSFRFEAMEQLVNAGSNGPVVSSPKADGFAQLAARHERLLTELTHSYLSKHESEMAQFFQKFERGNPGFNESSVYATREYVGKLRALKTS